MRTRRDLVILAGAEQTSDPKTAFQRFLDYAESGGVYLKLGPGEPRHAEPGCDAYVVFGQQIVGVLKYAGVDHSFVPSGNPLGGDDDPYTMEAGPALKFVGRFREVSPPVPFRKGFRGWQYLPEELRAQIHIRERVR